MTPSITANMENEEAVMKRSLFYEPFKASSWLAKVLAVIFVAFLAGCGGNLPATVQGTITIDGASLEDVAGDVMFHPQGGGAMAISPIAADGTFSINTGATKGLEPGMYDVTVTVVRIERATGGQNAPPQKVISPKAYSDRERSTLTADVVPGKNEFNFDLESSRK